MNLLDKSVGLMAALALLLFSCEDPSEIGISINPDDKIGVYFVELPVEASMLYIDSVNTGNTPEIFSGIHSDPELGLTEAIAYTQVSWNSASIAADAVLDSVTFTLATSYFYGADANTPQNFAIYNIAADTSIMPNSYYRTNYISFNETAIAEGTFLFSSEDDTSTSEVREDLFIFNMDDQFGLEIFNYFKNKPDVVEDTTEFYKNTFRGLAIKGRGDNNALVGFNISDTDSRLTFHYHTATTDSLKLNLSTYLGVQTQSGTFNVVPNFTYINTDRSVGILPTVAPYQEFTADGTIYSQYFAGLVPKLDLRAFDSFVDTAGTFVINKAEIILGNIQTPSEGLSTPNILRLGLTDELNINKGTIRSQTIFQNPGAPALDFVFNSTNKDYLGNAAFHFSDLKDGRINLSQALVYTFNSSIDQFRLNAEDIKLRIYYTKFK